MGLLAYKSFVFFLIFFFGFVFIFVWLQRCNGLSKCLTWPPPHFQLIFTLGFGSISVQLEIVLVFNLWLEFFLICLQIRSLGPTSPVERVCERSLSTTSVISGSTTTPLPPELDSLELGDTGVLEPVYSSLIESWFSLGLTKCVPSIRQHTVSVLAPLTIPLILKSFISVVTPDTCVKVFSKSKDGRDVYSPCLPSSLCPKQADPDRRILNTVFILIGRNFSQWKESLNGEINVLENSKLALRMQRNYQHFVSCVKDAVSPENKSIGSSDVEKSDENVVSPLIPRQRLLWITVRDRKWLMYMYNFNKDSCESLLKHCNSLIQWHNARWALLSSIVAQKLGLFHNQPCSARKHAHETLKNNPYIAIGELDSLVKQHGPPQQRDYNNTNVRKASSLPHTAHLEVFRDSKPTRYSCSVEILWEYIWLFSFFNIFPFAASFFLSFLRGILILISMLFRTPIIFLKLREGSIFFF